jgi:hypothetical protein
VKFKLEIDLSDEDVADFGIEDMLLGYLGSLAPSLLLGKVDGIMRDANGNRVGEWRTSERPLIRDRAIAMLPVPNNSEPGEQLYVAIVETGTPSQPEWCVGTCRWNDTEWDAGWWVASLPRALHVAQEKVARLTR